MSTTPSTIMIYLISGANRGVGLGLVKAILSTHPSAFVYAGARDVEGPTDLHDIKKRYPERISIVKCISADEDGNTLLAREIEGRHGHVDIVIANAGISDGVGSVLETPLRNVEDHFRTNVFGPLVLFQATHSLLRKSSHPKFITITSQAGSMDGMVVKHKTIGGAAYGASKAALNLMTRKIHFENDWIVAFPLSPGLVMTDMLRTAMDRDTTGIYAPLKQYAAQPDAAASSMLSIIDRSTREAYGGEFLNVDGEKAEW